MLRVSSGTADLLQLLYDLVLFHTHTLRLRAALVGLNGNSWAAFELLNVREDSPNRLRMK